MSLRPSKRKEVIERDQYTCQECGCDVVLKQSQDGETAHVHHITPITEGGDDSASNLITLCRSCHQDVHGHGVGGDPDGLWNDADRQILDVLKEGRVTPTLARRLLESGGFEYSRQYVSQRIIRLAEHGYVRNLYDTGLYELVSDPREDENVE